jgi:SPP1 family phage portal protein
MIDAYNKAISEKANDVDAFADAYLKVLGPRLEEEETRTIRQDRIINIETDNLSGVDVDFMQKPSADTTQENLINRLERLIFNISMVANISDENFATSSGIALRYKLKAMSDLANTKKRKFEKLLNNRYKVIFSNPISGMSPDSWVTLRYIFNFNYPANLAEEVDIASKMQGVTSKRTSLSVISAIDNVDDELAQIDEENDETEYNTDYAVNRTVDDELLGTADKTAE